MFRIAHYCLIVENLDAVDAFYREKLGFTTVFDFNDDKGVRFGTYLKIADNQFLELFTAGADSSPPKTNNHICFEVSDIQQAVQALRSRGAEVTDPTLEEADYTWQAWLEDPEQNKIELHQYTPDSKQLKSPESL